MKSSSSVTIKYTDPEKVKKAVFDYAKSLFNEYKEIKRIIWFGSWVNGVPSPKSDVDLSIIISHSKKRMRDRLPDYLPCGFPVGIDLFIYTESEFLSLKNKDNSMYKAILSGREIKLH